MNYKYLKNLEMDKIVAMAAERAACDEAKLALIEQLPSIHIAEVKELLEQTDALASILIKNGNPRISSCPGALDAVGRTVKGGVLSLGEIIAVRGALGNISRLSAWYGQKEIDSGSIDIISPLDNFFYALHPQPHIEKRIGEIVLSEDQMADNASDELYQLRRKIRQTEGDIRTKLDSFIKSQSSSKYLQDAVVSIRNGRFVVPVKSEHRSDVGGVIHDVSASGGTLFVEPTAVVEANAKIFQLQSQEHEEMRRILEVISGSIAEIAAFFESGYYAMLEIDKCVAKAELGLSMNGVKPSVNEDMCFSLVHARHPLLDKKTVVPVDISLGGEYDTMIITGPNTGGKTVSLKTAGLMCALAQMGYLLPVHDTSSVCVFEHILVDIGDEQSIEQSLSTFSGHMKNITEIFAVVNNRSLVLLDELGAGTDPAEGAALAISIIEKMRDKNARVMATTHYAELKMFALDTKGVQNAGSEFNIETLRPTYRLIMGVPGRSNAFLISEKLGIPASVIVNARRHMSDEQQRFETVLSQLEDLKLEVRDQQDEIEKLRFEAANQLQSAKEKRDELIRQGELELESARKKASDLTKDVENSAYSLLDEIKRLEKSERLSNTQKAQRAREIARKEAESLSKKSAGNPSATQYDVIPLSNVVVGQEVFWPEMQKNATVLSLPDKAYLVEIRVGAMKTKVPLARLSAPPKNQPQADVKNKKGSAKVHLSPSEPGLRSSLNEINLLGKTVDEALLEVDQFIDDAVMGKIEMVYIIHGRGTGALRAAIQSYLKPHKSIKSFRLGRYGEGEDGVTVAELK